ncbi:hypothetical protein AB5N19_12091 [Seiridium cardinale]
MSENASFPGTHRPVDNESQPLMSSASQSSPQRPMVPTIRAPVERAVSEGSVRQNSKHEAPVQHAHDTAGAFGSSQAGYKLKGIRDMSVTGNTSSIVQIIVNDGAEPRQFLIPRELLIVKAVKFGLGGDPADHKVTTLTLTNVNTDAFNLFVNWLYGRDLPKVELAEVFEACDTTAPKPHIDLAKLPLRGPVFSPTVKFEIEGKPYENSYQHICFMDGYKSHSPEEIRLKYLEYFPPANQGPPFSGSAGFNLTNNGPLSNSSMSNSRTTLSPQTTSTIKRQQSPSQSTHLAKRAKTEADDKNNNETIQMLLLSLSALARKFRWPKCFNQAIENYRFGERFMHRSFPKEEHIYLAYENSISSPNPIVRLVADYAFYCIVQSGSTLSARPAFAKKPLFMSDFMDRLDGTVIVPGCNVIRSGGNLQISTQPRMNEFRSTPLDNMHADNYRMDG